MKDILGLILVAIMLVAISQAAMLYAIAAVKRDIETLLSNVDDAASAIDTFLCCRRAGGKVGGEVAVTEVLQEWPAASDESEDER